MSHYDLVEATENALEYLNALSWLIMAGYAVGVALEVLWHMLCMLWMLCSIAGTFLGVLLWLLVHCA